MVKFKTKKAFSLMEVLIAAFVLTMGILATLQLITVAMRNSIENRRQIIASGLAQEGIEIVRNIRDTNMFNQLYDVSLSAAANFKNNLWDGTPEKKNCKIGNILASGDYALICGPSAGFKMCLSSLASSPAKFYYAASDCLVGDTETPFKRQIEIEYINNTTTGFPEKMVVKSTVWWSEEGNYPSPCSLSRKCLQIEDTLPKRD